jgi:hypothetical protein
MPTLAIPPPVPLPPLELPPLPLPLAPSWDGLALPPAEQATSAANDANVAQQALRRSQG